MVDLLAGVHVSACNSRQSEWFPIYMEVTSINLRHQVTPVNRIAYIKYAIDKKSWSSSALWQTTKLVFGTRSVPPVKCLLLP